MATAPFSSLWKCPGQSSRASASRGARVWGSLPSGDDVGKQPSASSEDGGWLETAAGATLMHSLASTSLLLTHYDVDISAACRAPLPHDMSMRVRVCSRYPVPRFRSPRLILPTYKMAWNRDGSGKDGEESLPLVAKSR
ncbi:hypothetical protein V2G26_001133 [Clonostachys chloroleuca]